MNRLTQSATHVITAVTAVASILAWVAGLDAPYFMGFIPARLSGLVNSAPAVPAFLTPLTTTLVHAGLVHLGFNLLMLLWCGAQVERVIGKTGLVILYLIGAYASALLQWAVNPAATQPMIGASGAISAVMGAYALSFGRAKALTSNLRVNRWINVAWLLAAWIVLQMMMGWLAGGYGYLLAIPAHIGGFAAGLLLQRPLLLWRFRKA
jgi:membrane associated rhomboid family serine protease